MRGVLFGCAWGFIFLAAAYDAHFAWEYRAVLDNWELNPLARWAAAECGLGAVFGFKFAALAFAACLAVYCRRRQRRLDRPLTFTIGSAYALLALHYLLSFQQFGPH